MLVCFVEWAKIVKLVLSKYETFLLISEKCIQNKRKTTQSDVFTVKLLRYNKTISDSCTGLRPTKKNLICLL